MKEIYTAPQLEITVFEKQDVISVSDPMLDPIKDE